MSRLGRFARRLSGRSWNAFEPPADYAYARRPEPLRGLLAVHREIARRIADEVTLTEQAPTLRYRHLLSRDIRARRVHGFRIEDTMDRSLAWCLLVPLDGELPYLRVQPQGWLPKNDTRLDDPTFDDTYRVDTEVPNDRSPLAAAWLRAIVTPEVRRELLTYRSIDWAIVGHHLLHLRSGATSPAEAIDVIEDEGDQLATIAGLIGPEVYRQFGTAALPPEPDWSDPEPEDTAEPPLVAGGSEEFRTWPLLPNADA